MMLATEPCPFCNSRALTIATRPGDTRAVVSCACGATGPRPSDISPRWGSPAIPYDESAIAEWNIWVNARREWSGK